MAKKKKQTRKKVEPEYERSAFWPLAGAILMFVLALFLFLGGFGTGGPLPKNLFNGAYWTLGWAAYLTPVALVFFGIHKFASEDRQIPFGKFMSMLALLAASATWAQVAFVTKLASGEFVGGHGGALGEAIGNVSLGALDKMPAAFTFFVFTVLLFFLTFGISPKILLKIFELFRGSDRDDTDLAELKARAVDNGFKLNEGVPVEHYSERDRAQLNNLKNTAQKIAPEANQAALTTASDPDWQFPSLELLSSKQDKADAGDVKGNAEIIKDTYSNFGIDVDVEGANVGPRVTQYTLRPPSGVKLTKLTALEHNLALDLAATSIRMEAPIPGKRAVGIEVPNVRAATVTLRGLLSSSEWPAAKGALSFVVGKDIAGQPVVADLEEMPHLLIAGQTKSGKSVMINTLLASFLYRNTPSDLKLILVDPKHVEMAPYEDIPHLLAPVVTEPEKCISALKWAVAEMERRLKTFAEVKQRDIQGYNALKKEEGMPHIVIVIDELADLMMVASRDVEALIARIAQKARAAGIHLVLATQRPDANIVTGIIKANVPAQIAFAVKDQVNSRIIIDQPGAEKLLGKGDMLFKTTDIPRPIRVQGALITNTETNKLTDFLREQRPPNYNDEVVSQPVQLNGKGGIVADYGGQDADDDMWRDAVQCVIEGGKASTSLLQRRLRIGYGRAARLIETMEEQGIISSADGNRPREVLVRSMDEVFGGGAGDDDVYADMPDEPDHS